MTSQGADAWRRTLVAPSGDAAAESRPAAPDKARRLQLVLAVLWLLDAVLQFQTVMFTPGFARTLAATAPGNPPVIAAPIAFSAQLIEQHAVVADAGFAAIQLLIGLGIAWRPTIRVALGASIGWSLAVWWLGEGLGGLFNGTASPANGAPGAVILYALLAVLLWPPGEGQPTSYAAAGRTGAQVARLLWLVLWGGLAVLALAPATAAPRSLSAMIAGMSHGEPAWLSRIDGQLARLLSQHGGAAAVALGILLAVIAVGIYLPDPARRWALALAILTAAGLWLAEGLGGVLAGTGTDPNTGPLLAVLAIVYWPSRQDRRDAAAAAAGFTEAEVSQA
jgi:hypothetical protein